MIDLDAVSNYKVLLVGDGIIDEYNYVTPIGKSIKENTISTVFQRKEDFRGGVWAAAEHLKTFCRSVDVKTGDSIMWNRRFVEEVYVRKLFTVHEKQPSSSIGRKDIGSYDLVIVTDFGHGTMTKALIKRVCEEAKYLCVNAQTNSQNYGFNMITKYPRAEFVVIDQLEARLAVHDNESPIEEVIVNLCKATGFKKVIVTMGNLGATGYDGGLFYHLPASADKVIDTMGAGDAFLAVSSPYACAGFQMKDLLEIGNKAAAVKCSIVGHRKYVTKEDLKIALDN